MGEVRVIDGGFLTMLQDARGRPGLGRFGIPVGGAVDRDAARLANRLVGTDPNAAVLEITMSGPTLSFASAAHIALTGADLGGHVAPHRLVPGHSHRVPAGATLGFARGRNATGGTGATGSGLRAYLAIEGGFGVVPVLGSASTDRRSAFGGFEGRALRHGDVLKFVGSPSGPLRSVVRPGTPRGDADPAIPVVATPSALGWFAANALDAFCAEAWTVAPDSDRNGIRLQASTRISQVEPRVAGIPSLGIPIGAVQIPPGGEPIILLADGPVTGGYPVIGCVPWVAHGRLAQASPGDVLRFHRVTIAQARRLEAEHTEAAHGRIDVDLGDEAAGWAR